MRYRANKKYHADADANADANRIHTENNMSPSPSVVDIILHWEYWKFQVNPHSVFYFYFIQFCYLSQLMRLWYLSHRRPAKTQASLRIRAVSPEPSLFAHITYGNRRMVRPKNQTCSPSGLLRMRV